MEGPVAQQILSIPAWVFYLICFLSIAVFLRTIRLRLRPIMEAKADPRPKDLRAAIGGLLWDGFLQRRQPRYLFIGLLHIIIFWGFLVLGLRSLELILFGLGGNLWSNSDGGFWGFYSWLKDIFEVLVLLACILAIIRRAILRPERYKGSHQFEAYLVLGMISFLMVTDILFEAVGNILSGNKDFYISRAISAVFLNGLSDSYKIALYNISYMLHILTFFVFLNILPLSKHFHIITSLPNVFLKKQTKGMIKPPRYDVENLEDLEYLGVKTITDFTWKHILDFYTCTECGRCSDNCPSNLTGRALSPKMLTLSLREHLFRSYPLLVKSRDYKGQEIPGKLVSEDVIWSCTTCGACEEECPVFIEYIDKIIDMRRYLVETGENPSGFNQVFMHLEKTGNPFGKPPSKRTDWIRELEVPDVRVLKKGEEVDTIFFVDSYASFDPRAQQVAKAIVLGLRRAGIDFGILGPMEKDSGHQVRRMGEEGLFELLREENQKALGSIGHKRIITADPHAFNTLKKDYGLRRPVYHYSEFFWGLLRQGLLGFEGPQVPGLYTFHDPCYLGRHNGIYEGPRDLLRAIPGIELLEMKRSKDRSFCCGGADVTLYHEVPQKERMASRRVQMALEVGADHIVTACPFCLSHLEDAVKTGGLEGRIQVVDLMELIISSLRG